MPEDKELLGDYACRRSESAFAEVVRRHVDLVFSAALRETRGDAATAEDITQAVFVELARQAGKLSRHPAVAGWLYTCVRRMSANARRADERRLRREREACSMNATNPADSTDAAWREIQPLLDDAMHELNETDRAAIVLRYFENRAHREVGLALGISESAARKRVDRALETLRALLSRRGAGATAALSAVISAHAVQAAPAGLAISISTATPLVAVSAATTIAMTTLQKVLIAAALTASIGAGIYQARQASALWDQVRALREQNGPLVESRPGGPGDSNHVASRSKELRQAGDASAELLRLRAEVTRLRKEAGDAAAGTADLKDFQTTILQVFSNTPPVRTLMSTATATVPWNQTVMTGGWKTPQGKRLMVFTTPQHIAADGNLAAPGEEGQILIQSKILEYTEETAASLGLAQFNADGQDADTPHLLADGQIEDLMKRAESEGGVELKAAPSVVVLQGREASINALEMRQIPSGEKYSTGPELHYLPLMTSDGKGVRMRIQARVNCSIYPPPEDSTR